VHGLVNAAKCSSYSIIHWDVFISSQVREGLRKKVVSTEGVSNNWRKHYRVLMTPDYSKPFNISSDACVSGIGFVCWQYDSEGRERPVTYCSCQLTHCEQRWSIYEQELLALVTCLKKFRHFVKGITSICLQIIKRWYISIINRNWQRNKLDGSLSLIYSIIA